MARREVLLDPRAAASPLTVRPSLGLQPTALGGIAQRNDGHVLVRQRGERHQTGRSGHSGNDEAIQVVEHGTREELSERTSVAVVSGAQPA